jgi:hypothetical protein
VKQNISQQHPEVRVHLARIAEGYSGELLISCLDWILVLGHACFPAVSRKIAGATPLAHAAVAGSGLHDLKFHIKCPDEIFEIYIRVA